MENSNRIIKFRAWDKKEKMSKPIMPRMDESTKEAIASGILGIFNKSWFWFGCALALLLGWATRGFI